MRWFLTLLHYECLLVLRSAKDIALMLGFGLIALSLMAITADPAWLSAAAPGMIWTVVLFSVLLMIERIFQHDRDSGRLDLLLSQPVPAWIIVLAKALGFWFQAGLPLILAAPMASLLMQLPLQILPDLLISLILGTPTLCLLATIGAALTLGARQPTLLVMVLVMPLLIPVLIFGALALERSLIGYSVLGDYLWLGVSLCLALACIPLGAVAINRNTTLPPDPN
ncbi:MAG: heme exporter protein CcmB [Alphaproteobacteria bacterium]|nr:heme exporter protein CcmB [Alphaproteobacteria bacterium]